MELYGKRGFGMWLPCQCPFHVILSCSVNVDERSPPTLLFIESFSMPLLGNQSYHSTFSFWLRRFLHIQNPSPMLLIISHFTAATACLLAAAASSSSSPFYAIQIDLWGHLPVPVFSQFLFIHLTWQCETRSKLWPCLHCCGCYLNFYIFSLYFHS